MLHVCVKERVRVWGQFNKMKQYSLEDISVSDRETAPLHVSLPIFQGHLHLIDLSLYAALSKTNSCQRFHTQQTLQRKPSTGNPQARQRQTHKYYTSSSARPQKNIVKHSKTHAHTDRHRHTHRKIKDPVLCVLTRLWLGLLVPYMYNGATVATLAGQGHHTLGFIRHR